LSEFAELATMFIALNVATRVDRQSEAFLYAEALLWAAVGVNSFSLLPLWGLLSTLRTDAALSEAVGRAYSSHQHSSSASSSGSAGSM